VLLKTVKGELCLVVDEDLERLSNKCQITGGRWNESKLTLAMNFLQVARISFARVALNIMTCLW
jgi:hypothetical protein